MPSAKLNLHHLKTCLSSQLCHTDALQCGMWAVAMVSVSLKLRGYTPLQHCWWCGFTSVPLQRAKWLFNDAIIKKESRSSLFLSLEYNYGSVLGPRNGYDMPFSNSTLQGKPQCLACFNYKLILSSTGGDLCQGNPIFSYYSILHVLKCDPSIQDTLRMAP